MSTMSGFKKFLSSVWEVLEVVLVSAAVVFLIRQFIAQPFLVSGASMEPNFYDGNYLIVDELTYRFGEPERGDVIVHRYPKDPKTFFIKRIIGIPGDKVTVRKNEVKVFNKGVEIFLNEKYLPKDTFTIGGVEAVLGPDQYFVMGDNRLNSLDSRSWGPLEKKYIVGIVRARLLPVKELGIIQRPGVE